MAGAGLIVVPSPAVLQHELQHDADTARLQALALALAGRSEENSYRSGAPQLTCGMDGPGIDRSDLPAVHGLPSDVATDAKSGSVPIFSQA